MEFRFVPAVALIQRQEEEEDVLAKGKYSRLWNATLPFTQASVEQSILEALTVKRVMTFSLKNYKKSWIMLETGPWDSSVAASWF